MTKRCCATCAFIEYDSIAEMSICTWDGHIPEWAYLAGKSDHEEFIESPEKFGLRCHIWEERNTE